MQQITRYTVGILAAMGLTLTGGGTLQANPHIIVVLADDLGYGDLSAFNPHCNIDTPHLDRLAREGLRMTDAHAPGSVCVPSRYGLLTGVYPWRRELPWRERPVIDDATLTIAGMLQSSGYHTVCLGKWHQGFAYESYDQPHRGGPMDRGFAHYFGIPASLDIPPYYYLLNDRAVAPPTESIEASSSEGWTPIQGAFWREGGIAPGFQHAEVTPELFRRAVEEIHRAETRQGPLFLYLALPSPHTPWLPTEEFRGRSRVGMYGDFVMQVDAGIGALLKALGTAGMSEDTLLVFTSDNGPVWYAEDVERFAHASVGPLRGMKGDAWEGGHRVPWLARWPGRIPAGVASDALICHTDLMATLAAVTRSNLPAGQGGDSVNQLPVWLESGSVPAARRRLVQRSSRGFWVVREAEWKWIDRLGSGGFSRTPPTSGSDPAAASQLYDLSRDLAERENLAERFPERVTAMRELLQEVRDAD